MKLVRLSALLTELFTPQEISLVLISVKRLSRSQGHSAAGRIRSIENSDDIIGNRTRDLHQLCHRVPLITFTTTKIKNDDAAGIKNWQN